MAYKESAITISNCPTRKDAQRGLLKSASECGSQLKANKKKCFFHGARKLVFKKIRKSSNSNLLEISGRRANFLSAKTLSSNSLLSSNKISLKKWQLIGQKNDKKRTKRTPPKKVVC